MKTFSEDSKCTKCGAMQASMKFWRDSQYHVEWLERICRRCGYAWEEACLDVKEAPDARD